MVGRPGTPRLLREINDRAALELLLGEGPMTRAQVGSRTGLSKVTASQMLTRLEERGLISVAGQQAGGRGPNAALYAVVPSSAYVAGLDVAPEAVTAGVADVTGRVLTEVRVNPNGVGDPVQLVHGAVSTACNSAGQSGCALLSSAPAAWSIRKPVTCGCMWTCPTGTRACSMRCGATCGGR